jgi:chaperonin GroES
MNKIMNKVVLPLRDYVHVKLIKYEETSRSGIVMPVDEKNASFSIGTVLAVGPGKHDKNGNIVETGLKVGDTVILGHWAGAKLNEDERLVKCEDIMARCVDE